MQELLLKIPDWIQAFALIGMCVSILATLVARLTPSTADDEKVAKFVAALQKILAFLPTIGINPQTKKLQEELERLKASEK